MDITITPITPDETPALLELIRELARFEKLEHEVESTAASLRDAFFGSPPAASALLVRCDGEAVGYAIYYFTFSSFVGRRGIWLEDLYVRPQFRQRGLGRQLIEAVARIGVEQNCGRYEWMVLEWNAKAREFYRSLGAMEKDEWILLRFDAAELKQLAAGKKS